MLKVALRGLMAHKARLLTTFLAVALGVAFMGGVLVLTDTTNRSFDDLFADVFRDTDAVVRSDQTIDSDFGEMRGQIDESLLPQVQDADGVADAAGSVDGYAQVIDKQGDAVGDPAMGAPTFGTNWVDVDDLNPFDLTDGEAPTTDDEIVIDRGTAEDTGYVVGDTVPVQTRDGVDDFELVGIVRFGTADNPGGASYVMWTVPEAQRLIGEEGRFSTISATAQEGTSQSELADSIRSTLDADGDQGVEVVTGQEITEETQSDIKQQLSFLTIFLGIFAGIALFVGIFVIYNSFSIIVAQRTREMALLRAIGARRRQVRRAVLAEALVVGAIGSLVGFVVGLGLASLFSSLLELPSGSLAILPASVITALVTGVVVTVVSALLPAWRASRVPPLAAMRDVAVDRVGRSRVRFVAGLVVMVVALGLVIAGALGDEPARVGFGAALLFVALVLVAPGLARPVSRALGTPVARLRGTTGRLARENAARNPRRTSATAQALMIGVGLVAFIFVINSSIRASIDKTLDDSFVGDFVVDSGTFGMVGLPTSVATDIAEIPDVGVVAPLRFSPATVDGDDTNVTGATDGAFELLDLRVVDGTADLTSGEVVITQDKADSDGLALGDPITISFLDDHRPEADRTGTVAGIYDDSTASGGIGSVVLGLDDFSAAVPTSTDAQVFVQLRDGVSVAEAEPEIERVVAPYATAKVQSVDEYKDTIGGQLDFFLNLIVGLLALSVIIAVLGIANTIALSVLERTRELGLLRAVGMRRRQVRSTVRWEAVIISLFGTVLGLAFGLVGGWGIVRSLRDEGFGVFEVPVGPLVFLALMGAFVGVLAAAWPAYRASRLDVLEAIGSE
ncbi:MAG TPA: FtsX-like permease family protein [Acidimicrobiales bacterium]|nr:FtsX-like permease family protein [Acidimicrobiales bacterium]